MVYTSRAQLMEILDNLKEKPDVGTLLLVSLVPFPTNCQVVNLITLIISPMLYMILRREIFHVRKDRRKGSTFLIE